MQKIMEVHEMGFRPLEVTVRGDNLEDAVRRFRTLVQSDGLLLRLKERERYEKPSDKKRRKSREAQRRAHQLEMMEKMIISGEWDKRQEKKEKKRLEKISQKKTRVSAIEF